MHIGNTSHSHSRQPSSVSIVRVTIYSSPLVGSQRQAGAIYLDLSNAFNLVPHSLLLHKLSAFGLSGGYINWFCNYLFNSKLQVRISGILSSPSEILSSVPQGSALGPRSSVCLLLTCVMQLPTLSIYSIRNLRMRHAVV
jgi:hypothetical protein